MMQLCRNYFGDDLSEEVVGCIEKTRDFVKPIIMCSTYNQEFGGRFSLIKGLIKDRSFFFKFKSDFKFFYSKFPDFMDEVFCFLNTKRLKLNTIVRLYLTNSGNPIILKTLDQSLLK